MLGNDACPNQLTSLENDEDDYQRYRLVQFTDQKFYWIKQIHWPSRVAPRIIYWTKNKIVQSTEQKFYWMKQIHWPRIIYWTIKICWLKRIYDNNTDQEGFND